MQTRTQPNTTDCAFINLNVSTLTDKWYGETPKLVTALFSLAAKVQPTIIFIDEIGMFVCLCVACMWVWVYLCVCVLCARVRVRVPA